MAWRAAAADVDELAYALPEPSAAAVNIAVAKGRGVASAADEVTVAADTLVLIEGEVLAKPGSDEEAISMLRRLRGRAHQVLSGVALLRARDVEWCGVVSTRVVMRDYTAAEIEAYVARGEPFDKAGGYAVQDDVFRPVERLEGCYLNVVGLPLCAVSAGLTTLGVPVESAGRPPCGYCARGAPLVRSGS